VTQASVAGGRSCQMHNAIVILQNDPVRAQNLVSKVRSVSEAVFLVQSLLELRRC
jgi:hypothetical protein